MSRVLTENQHANKWSCSCTCAVGSVSSFFFFFEMEEEEANAYLVVSQVKFCARTLKVPYQFRISESHISRMKTRKCRRALQEGFFSVSYLQDHVFKFVPPKIAVLNV